MSEDKGKQRGKHGTNKLSAIAVKNQATPGKYGDGNGLYLIVDPSGSKRWELRIVIHEKRRDLGLGGFATVSLAEAREKALAYRKIARDGGDPVAELRKKKTIPTFEVAANTVHTAHKPSWKNQKHAAQWISTLEEYAFPFFGNLKIDRIESADILKALAPIWLTKPETARRVRQRVGNVLDWAVASGHRVDNPISSVSKGLPKQQDKQIHHAALPYTAMGEFLGSLKSSDNSPAVKLAMEFLILTATRSNETLNATWSEIDLKTKMWVIPASRMKAKVEHRIPLSDRALKILEETKLMNNGTGFIFPGGKQGKALSNMALPMALRRMNVDSTVHGFRSTFRDWTAEKTHFVREVCEAALSHTVQNKVEAAYRRTDLFEKRRELMVLWAAYVMPAKNNVVSLAA